MHHHHHGHTFGHGHGPVRLPGQRAKRGIVQAAVIALLKEQDMHGYQIIQELSERSGGMWNPSPGSVYPALQALEQSGMVTSAEEAGGKRVFSLTELGRKHAEHLPDRAPWEAMNTEGSSHRLRDGMAGLMAATSQIARAGDAQQIDRAADILAEARKRIYLILAGEE